jgi:hypothetical protein
LSFLSIAGNRQPFSYSLQKIWLSKEKIQITINLWQSQNQSEFYQKLTR